MEADRNAPVFAESSIDIDAPPETVWDVMSQIDEWATWNPDVRQAQLQDGLHEGSTFRWKSGPGTITSTLQEVRPPQRLAWTGRTLGIKAIHVWNIEPRDSGSRVTTEESWDGLIVKLIRGPSQRTLEKALNEGPRHLKAEAERRSAAV